MSGSPRTRAPPARGRDDVGGSPKRERTARVGLEERGQAAEPLGWRPAMRFVETFRGHVDHQAVRGAGRAAEFRECSFAVAAGSDEYVRRAGARQSEVGRPGSRTLPQPGDRYGAPSILRYGARVPDARSPERTRASAACGVVRSTRLRTRRARRSGGRMGAGHKVRRRAAASVSASRVRRRSDRAARCRR